MSHKNAETDHSAHRTTMSLEDLEGAERHTLTHEERAQIQRHVRFHRLCSLADKLQAALTTPMRDIEAELQELTDRIEKLESLSPDRMGSEGDADVFLDENVLAHIPMIAQPAVDVLDMVDHEPELVLGHGAKADASGDGRPVVPQA